MENPSELSLAEIRNYMLFNNYKVTNHSLVKHFKRFLTNPETQNEARKQFKTYVNILATIKNENNQKFLILREKYFNECPSEDVVNPMEAPMSPGATSIISDGSNSPLRRPPPYKPPPEVSPTAVKVPILQEETKDNYRDCISEFQAAISHIDSNRVVNQEEPEKCAPPPTVPPRKRASTDRSVSRESSVDDNKENVSVEISSKEVDSSDKNILDSENQISVKEVTKKFNRMASEEEAKVISPSSKKKPEVIVSEDKMTTDDQVEEKATPDVTLSHPEARKWIVSAAKSDYQELAKLASKHPELVKLQDPTTGYTALHWAAKHGNENVVKLIAGTYKANVNARTNGGYTPLHLAVQYGKDDIFELLCNVYKANRDLTDWSGNKPLDYSKQSTTVSASTYSSEYGLLEPEFLHSHLRSSSAGGTLTLTRKKRSHQRFATSTGVLSRAQSMSFGNENKSNRKGSFRRGYNSPPTSSPSDDYSFEFFSEVKRNASSASATPIEEVKNATLGKRKGSFLRKKFRPASRQNTREVAFNSLAEK